MGQEGVRQEGVGQEGVGQEGVGHEGATVDKRERQQGASKE